MTIEAAKERRARETIESLTRQLADVREDRAALAAKVEEMTVAIIEANEHEGGSLDQQDAFKSVYMQAAMYPATTLARRDARIKAEALEEFTVGVEAAGWETSPLLLLNALRQQAATLRRKYEGGDV